MLDVARPEQGCLRVLQAEMTQRNVSHPTDLLSAEQLRMLMVGGCKCWEALALLP